MQTVKTDELKATSILKAENKKGSLQNWESKDLPGKYLRQTEKYGVS